MASPSLRGEQAQNRPTASGPVQAAVKLGRPGGLFEVEVMRADGKGTVHRIRAKTPEAARYFVEKLIEPDIAENPKIVRLDKVE